MQTGVPQWFALRGVWYGGTLNGTNEVDMCLLNGLANTSGVLTEPSITHTVTAGPQSVGPVMVYPQGTAWALPFNVSCGAPQYVWDELKRTTDATVGPWTYT